jgi:hypothetical protein
LADFGLLIGRTAGAISLLSFVPYIRAIFRGTTKPSRTSWWIWALTGGIVCAGTYVSGAGEAVWVPASEVAGPLVIAMLSIRHGVGGMSRLDHACIAGAAASLALWWASGSPDMAIATNLALDCFGAVPTLVKAYRAPDSEDVTTWALLSAGNALNLLALPAFSFGTSAFTIYLLAMSVVMVSLIVLRSRALVARGCKRAAGRLV